MFKKFIIFSIILGLILTPFSFDFPQRKVAQGAFMIPGEDIVADTTWTLAKSPYVFDFFTTAYIYIYQGVTLTIEPGVVVKLKNVPIFVDGELRAQGTEENPVVFTSNNPSGLSDDWGPIIVGTGGKLNLNHTVINYGNGVSVEGGEIEINNSTITDNIIGLLISEDQESQVVIHNSEIYNNQEGGIENFGPIQVDATNNWWGDNSGPFHPTLNPQGLGNSVSDNVLFDPWISKQKEREPVIVIPGIVGSWNIFGKWELDPIFHVYDNLW